MGCARNFCAVRPRGLGWAVCLLLSFVLTVPALGKPHEARIPLDNGSARLGDVSAALCKGLGVPAIHVPGGRLDLNGVKGSNFIAAMDAALGDACRVTIKPDALILHVDCDRLPADCDAAKRAVRVFTTIEAPEATAAQRKAFGLHLPKSLRADRPLVILIHGLDSDCTMWDSLKQLLEQQSYQVACFGYPSDGPINESEAMLARHLAAFRAKYPHTPINLICHSMGGLVARAYVEGPDYAGGVDHLILCGTPNAGSTWSRYRLILQIHEHYHLWRTDPQWSPTWMITDGLGEAGDDLAPGSPFLKKLNSRPRRAGVKYTIVAGNQHVANRIEAGLFACTANCIPHFAANWWGLRQCRQCLIHKASSLLYQPADSDGPVALKSCKLKGVSDVVIVHADHSALCMGTVPAAWPVIKKRLK